MEKYFHSGLAPSSHRSYDSAKRRFVTFCEKSHLNPLPLNENLLCRYTAYLAEDGLAPSTIKLYLSAVRHLQIAMGLPDPKIGDMARLEQVLKGAKREYAKKSPGRRERLPITPDILLEMKGVWNKDPKNFNNIMLWAACCLCYFGFLRSGEITVPSEAAYDQSVHLNMSDIAIDSIASPSSVRVSIKASKTDQFRRGVDIYVGKTNNPICPVEALTAYIARRGTDEGPFFKFEDDRLLTKDRFVSEVRKALLAASIEAKAYSGHSFRIGAATTAGRKGLSSERIKTLGRWESAAYLLYIRLPREELSSISKVISTK